MNCPICQHGESQVVRTDQEVVAIKRRRQCLRCGHRWNTFETPINTAAELAEIKRLLIPVAELVK